MKIERERLITRELLAKEPNKIFVFEDNIKRANQDCILAECREAQNTFGVSTHWEPGQPFGPGDGHEPISIMESALMRLHGLANATAHTIVWPISGIGTQSNGLCPELRQTLDGMIMDVFGIQNAVCVVQG